jgi:hypothetical protein
MSQCGSFVAKTSAHSISLFGAQQRMLDSDTLETKFVGGAPQRRDGGICMHDDSATGGIPRPVAPPSSRWIARDGCAHPVSSPCVSMTIGTRLNMSIGGRRESRGPGDAVAAELHRTG